jgi:hypothetical protein
MCLLSGLPNVPLTFAKLQNNGAPAMTHYGKVLPALLSVLFLTACGDNRTTSNESANAIIDDSGSGSEPVDTNTNRAPLISGTPATSVEEGSDYSFTPTADDADGDSLSFSVENLPYWATFNSGTGRVSGTPDSNAAGTYSDLIIRVSDGQLSTELPGFNIIVADVASDTQPEETAPTLVSAVVSGTDVVLGWTHDGPTPDGGYDIFIDGVDMNNEYRTTGFTATVTGLDLTVGHCFNIQSRYPSSKTFITSNQVCSEAQIAETGSLELRWTAPVTRADGTELEVSEIDGYYIYLGETAETLQIETELDDGQIDSFTFENLTLGTYFVALTVYDTDGNESSLSNVLEVTVDN